jgi:L-seryl-tRNA(Ser) seleniumtransferase
MEKPTAATIPTVAEIYESMGRHEEAQRALAELDRVQIPPAVKELIRGDHLMRHGQPTEAIAQYLAAIARPAEDVRAQAEALAQEIRGAASAVLKVEIAPSRSEVGGGSLPGQALPTWVVTLRSRRISADDLSRHFRLNAIPVFGRIESGLFMLDVRTVAPPEEPVIVECVEKLVRR